MSKTRRLVLVLFVGLAATLGALPAAQAADTITTFTITTDGLVVVAQPAASLGSTAIGSSSLSGTLGLVTVTDARGGLAQQWSSQVSSTDFTTGAGTPAETITKSHVSYASGPATAQSGICTRSPGQPTVGDAVPLSAPVTAFSCTNGTGLSVTSWNPTVIVDLPAAAVGGTYSGVITHSVG
jgi:hypothetical protein